jgi:hypothetical protein
MARLRPRGRHPGRGRVRVVAVLRFPGLALTAAPVRYTLASAGLDMPGLAVVGRVTQTGVIAATQLDMPGLAVAAGIGGYVLLSATLAMPGLALTADFVAATLTMPGLAVPRANLSAAPGMAASLLLPGLEVPRATVGNVVPVVAAATLAMPGMGLAAALDPPGATFRLAPDYRTDWVKLQGLTTPSVVQTGSPVSTGVVGSGGPGGSEATGNVLLASKNKSGPGWSAAFSLKRTDAYAPPAGGGAAFLILYFGAIGDGAPGRAQAGPYPWSATYDPLVLTGSATSFGVNADQWPTTTTPASTVLAAWGDGNGFNNNQPRSTLGISEVSGTPPSLTGTDKYLSGTAVNNRKPNAILALGGSTVLLWHVNQTLDARAGTYTAISTDGGLTWTFHEAAGERVFSTGGTPPLQVVGAVQAGPGYAAQSSTLDVNYAHLYLNNSGNLGVPFTGTNGTIWLCRVKIGGTGGAVANIYNPLKYSFFNGLDSAGAPIWTADGGNLDTSKSVFVNPVGMGKHFLVGWSQAAGRYFGALTPTATTVAVYEAPRRWGPWTTLFYGPGSDPNWTALFTVSLPGPWQTATKVWLAASGAPPDSLDVQSSPLAALSNPGFPVDLAQWSPSLEPYTTTIAAHITGARLTFFFNNNASGVDPAPSVPSLAVFAADGSVTSIAADLVSGVAPAGLAQARNTPYDYTLALSTASPAVLTLTQHDASVPSDRTITWTSALLNSRASPSQGGFAWLWTPGRVVEITGENFAPPSAPRASATLVLPGLAVPTAQVDPGSVVVSGFANGYSAVRRLVRSAQTDLAAESTADLPSFHDSTEIPGDWSFLAPAPSVDPGASSAFRPFAASAAWNIPAAALPTDLNSAALCDLLWNGADATPGNCNIEYKDYSFPVYYASTGTDPNATLPRSNDTYTVSCAGKPINGTSIPWNSAWTIPAGSDGQVIVLDPATGREWDLWQVAVNTGTKVVTCSNGTVLADYRTGNGQNLPSRAIGIQYLAMLPRPWEVAQGRIDHCLPMGIINVLKVGGAGKFVAPAIKEDASGAAWGTNPGLPEGARFCWSFTDAERDAWLATLPAPRRAAARVIGNALREYGVVITDHSGGWHIQLEDRASAGAAWDALGLVDDDTTRDLLGGLITATNFRAVAPPPYPAFTGKLLSWADGVPLDLRLETEGGAKLDHQVVRWDGAGSGRFFVREPAGSTSDADFRAMLYYGKAGLTVSEENVGQVWRGASLVIDPTSGADLTGRGRSFTRTGALTNTTLDGRPAVAMADQAGGHLRRTSSDLALFDGLANGPTEEFWAIVGTAVDGSVSRLGGDITDASQAFQRARFSSWAEKTGTTSGTQAGVLQVGTQWWSASAGKYTSESTESIAGIADGSTLRHLFFVRQSGATSAIYDGETDIASAFHLGAVSAGTIHPQSYDNLSLGAGTGTQNTSPGMTLGLYVVWPRALSATWRAMLDRTQRDSSLCWGLGAEDTFANADNSPVGKPWRDSITAATFYSPGLHAYDPDPGAALTATAVTPASDPFAAYAIQGGQLKVTPVAGTPGGVGRPLLSLSDGTKVAQVRPYISVGGGVVVQSTAYSDFALPAPVGASVRVTNGDELRNAIGSIQAGGHIILVRGSTFAGNVTITRDIPSPARCVIRAEDSESLAGSANAGLLADLSGNLTLNGDGWVVKGINFVPSSTTSARLVFNGSRIRVTRFRIVDGAAGRDNQVTSGSGSAVKNVILDRFEVGNRYANGLEWGGAVDRDITVSWFYIHDGQGKDVGNNTGHQPMFIGTAASQSQFSHVKAVGYGVLRNDIGSFEIKGSNMLVEQMSMLNASDFHFRHGNDNIIRGIYCNDAGLQVRGINNTLLSCVTEATKGQSCVMCEGNFNIENFYPYHPKGNSTPPDGFTHSPRANSVRCNVVDCTFDQEIQLGFQQGGDDDSYDDQLYKYPGGPLVRGGGHSPAKDNLFAKCTVAGKLVTSKTSAGVIINTNSLNAGNHESGTRFQSTVPAGFTPVTPARLTAADVGWNTPAHKDDGGAMP